jgi:hypothetical protein
MFLCLNSVLALLILTACNSVRFGTAPGTKVVDFVNPFPTPWQTSAPTRTPSSFELTAAPQIPNATVCPPFTIDAALPVPDEPQNYIGLHFDILPDGLESHLSFLLDGPDADYIIREVVKDSDEMLWLERVICHNDGGHPYTEIRAVLDLPTRQEKERLITGTCKVNEVATPMVTTKSEFDNEIVAIGQFEDFDNPPATINYAWRTNPRAESFEALSPDTVTCAGLRGA